MDPRREPQRQGNVTPRALASGEERKGGWIGWVGAMPLAERAADGGLHRRESDEFYAVGGVDEPHMSGVGVADAAEDHRTVGVVGRRHCWT